jgi:hypothetical protein
VPATQQYRDTPFIFFPVTREAVIPPVKSPKPSDQHQHPYPANHFRYAR